MGGEDEDKTKASGIVQGVLQQHDSILFIFIIHIYFPQNAAMAGFARGVLFRCLRQKLISVYVGEMPRTFRCLA